MIEDDIEAWKYLVGSAILKFGEIEWATYQLWSYFNQGVKTPKEFKKRIDKIIGLIHNDTRVSDANKEKLKNLLGKARSLAEKRNDIAHNPVQINVYVHRENPAFILEKAEVNNVLDDRIISFKDLNDFFREIEPLTDELYTLMSSLSANE